MCCFLSALFLLGPRVAALVWWLFWPALWNKAFDTIVWPIVGIIFAPWTTLLYVVIQPISGGWDWFFLVLAILADLASYGGGGYSSRRR